MFTELQVLFSENYQIQSKTERKEGKKKDKDNKRKEAKKKELKKKEN